MTPSGTVRALVAALLCALALLTGCVIVPTTGPVERVGGVLPACRDCINVDVDPPAPGADPLDVVQGFLRATSNFQPNYATAREYLTERAAGRWSPEAGVSIYTGGPVLRSEQSVVFEGQLVGALGADRTYTAVERGLQFDFGIVRDQGEWRIDTPPTGLMVADYSFASFYRAYDLYFVGRGGSLVPDRIYLPNLPGGSGVASVLVKELLEGPSAWLQPAVTSAVPLNTTLSVDSVTITNGVAEVPLAGELDPLDDQRRSLLAAQVVLTLRQATSVIGVRFTVNGQLLAIPGADSDTQVYSFDSVPTGLEPVRDESAEQLTAVRGRSVLQVSANAAAPEPSPLPGPLGEGAFAPNSLAVSTGGTEVAVVTDGRTALRRSLPASGPVQTLLSRASGLLRPQFSRYGELWALGREKGQQRFWVFIGEEQVAVQAPFLEAGEVTAFKISPDGTRMAAIRRIEGRTELGLVRITRAEVVGVDGWRVVDLTTNRTGQLTRIADVGWADATDMVVLAAGSVDQPLTAYRISDDGYRVVAIGEQESWDAVSVTVLLRTQVAVVLGRNGQAFRNEGSQWEPYVDDVTAVGYPG